METPVISEQLRAKAGGFRDGLGAEWLRRLPELIARCRERWSFTLGGGFSYPALSFVARCYLPDGTSAVLKIGFLLDELADEIAMLRRCDGRGMVRLLDADPAIGALLLERAKPGKCLAELGDDEEAAAIAAQVMHRIWTPAPDDHPYPTVAGWCAGLARLRERFLGGTGPLPRERVEWVEQRIPELIATSGTSMLLHGDLHHFNVLSSDREPWLAIDPKGVVGDPAYELAAFLANEWTDAPDPVALQTRRIREFADGTGLDAARILDWGRVHSVLSAWWSIEDGGECPPKALRHIEVLVAVRVA